MAQNDGGSEALFAFLLGAAAGAGAALLLAPTDGEETRERLAEWLKKAEKKGEKFLHEQRELLAEKKDRLGDALQAGKKAYRDANEG